MKHTLTLLAAILCLIAHANDGIYYTSGNQLVPLAETRISVKKEILTISLTDQMVAKVDVYYEFFNPDKTDKTVLMGFEADPSYNDDLTFYPDARHKHIKDFTVEMNGQKLTHKNAVSTPGKFSPLSNPHDWDVDDEMGMTLVNKTNPKKVIEDYAYVYYFNATFRPGINRVHHTYAYTMSMTVLTNYEIPYKLSPAGRWAGGKIDDFTLIIRADNTAKHFLVNKSCLPNMRPIVSEGTGKTRPTTHYDVNYWEISLRNGAITFHTSNFRPTTDEELYIHSADHMTSFNNEARFGEYYDRSADYELSIWRDRLEDPDTNVSAEWLKRIARNLPYANRGRIFHNPEVKAYIESLWWYMPDPNYTDDTATFTPKDWLYINYDPLSDEDEDFDDNED